MKKAFSALTALAGVIMVAFSVSVFYVPNKIVSGGVSGLSTIIFYTLGIPTSVTYAAVNILLVLIGFWVLGKGFIIKSFLCSMILSGFIEVFSRIPPITDNILLAAVFGGVVYGFGIGLAFSQNASTGGTDILGRLVQHFFPHMPIGKLLLMIDGAVILTSFFVFRNTELILFGIIALMVSSFAIDYLIRKLNISKLAFVITDKGNEIAQFLISTSTRGVTVFDVTGAYSNEKKTMLMCAIKEREMPAFQKKITEMDKHAFTIFSESQQIVGNGFHVYR